ncbi:MAG: hypothetical protein ACOX3K_02270 [Bacilli bacterium]|jgi:hypothetical protein
MYNKGIIIIYNDFTEDWLPILKASSIKLIGLHSLYKLGGVEAYLEWLHRESTKALIEKFEAEGFIFVHQLHVLDYLLPKSLFENHREWFRENKDHERINDWNLCPSNAEVLQYIENRTYELALALRQKNHKYYLWPDDSIDSICYCKKCAKLTGADQAIIIAEAMLKGLKRYDENAKLSFLAYQDAMGEITIEHSDNLFLQFAPILRNHNEPITSNDEKNKHNRAVLNALKNKFKDIEILEYYLDASYFCQWKKENVSNIVINKEVLARDCEFYKSSGATTITTFAGFINKQWFERFGTQAFKDYVEVINKYF